MYFCADSQCGQNWEMVGIDEMYHFYHQPNESVDKEGISNEFFSVRYLF